MRPGKTRLLINAILFQLSWFVCVLGAAQGSSLVGIAATLIAVAVLALMSEAPVDVGKLAALGLGAGLVVETVFLGSGFVSYASPGPVATLPPVWILAMWVGFAAITNELLSWLHGRWSLQILFGLVGAPLSYLAGSRLGAMTFHEPTFAGVLLIAILWAVAFPLLMAGAAAIARGHAIDV